MKKSRPQPRLEDIILNPHTAPLPQDRRSIERIINEIHQMTWGMDDEYTLECIFYYFARLLNAYPIMVLPHYFRFISVIRILLNADLLNHPSYRAVNRVINSFMENEMMVHFVLKNILLEHTRGRYDSDELLNVVCHPAYRLPIHDCF